MAADVDPPGPSGASGPELGDGFLLPSEIRRRRRRQRAANRVPARAGRAVRRRVGDLFGAGGPAFTVLANAHAASTAGDTLIAIALANSLFFAVPSSEARGNVALYLLLTVAPFAVIGPLLGRVFDLPKAERRALIGSSLIRVVAATMLVLLTDTWWLFPLAFTLLVLSRVHGISRSALLPQALTNPIALVTANARLAQISVVGGALAVPVGAGLSLLGPQAVLVGAAVAFAVATWQSLLLTDLDGQPAAAASAPSPDPPPLPLHTRTPLTERFWHRGEVHEGRPPIDVEPLTASARVVPPADEAPEGAGGAGTDRTSSTPGEVAHAALARGRLQLRLARLATAVVRLLNGFLVLILAFAFRDVDAPVADFGAVLAAAGGGYALAAVAAPRLERSLREEPMVVAALAVEAAAAFIAGQFFSLAAAAFLSLAAGYAWGTAKFAFDGLLQGTVLPSERGRAFTSSETTFQLAWVAGALIPTALVVDERIGLIFGGITALFAQTVYVSRLLQRTP